MKLELSLQKDRSFPLIDEPSKYTDVRIWNCRYSTLAPLAQFENLEALEIFVFPDSDFQMIMDLTRLKILKIIDFPKVQKLDGLARLKNLEELELIVKPSSNRPHHIDSLKPLKNLKQLRAFALRGIIVDNGSLQPLYSCTSLREFHSGNLFSTKEFASLKAKMPHLEGYFLQPVVNAPDNYCKKCGEQMIFLSGILIHPIKCPHCNAQRVNAHIAEWASFQARTHN